MKLTVLYNRWVVVTASATRLVGRIVNSTHPPTYCVSFYLALDISTLSLDDTEMGCSSSKDVIAPIGAAGKAVGGAVDHINPFTANGDPNSR